MSARTDTVSRRIHAPAPRIYRAFATAEALLAWMPPPGMRGTLLAFDFSEGGGYRMRLVYDPPQPGAGKTTDEADEVAVDVVRLVPDSQIEQRAHFISDDPSFAGDMRVLWRFEASGDSTLVTVRCENVPPGIPADVHEEGLAASLAQLAEFTERS